MKKVMLVLFGVLALSTGLWAQGDNPGCAFNVSGTDDGCVDVGDCSSASECTSYHFTPTCAGTYHISAWTTCNPGNCFHCATCVTVYDAMPPSTPLMTCATTDFQHCQTHQEANCDNTCTMTLTGGKPYIMVVCLIRCPGNPGCLGCTEGGVTCTAHGCVRYNLSCLP